MPFGVLGLDRGWRTASMGAGQPDLFAAAYLNRVTMALVAGWGVVRDRPRVTPGVALSA